MPVRLLAASLVLVAAGTSVSAQDTVNSKPLILDGGAAAAAPSSAPPAAPLAAPFWGGGGLNVSTGPTLGTSGNQLFGGDKWSLFGSGSIDSASSRGRARAGPSWNIKAQATYLAPGAVRITAGVIGRRGSALPLFMAQPFGTDTLLPDPPTALVYGLRLPVLWDTQLRVQKRIKDNGGATVDLVFEGINLVPVPRTELSPTLTSRALRAGVLFGF